LAPCRPVIIQKLTLGPTKPIGCIGPSADVARKGQGRHRIFGDGWRLRRGGWVQRCAMTRDGRRAGLRAELLKTGLEHCNLLGIKALDLYQPGIAPFSLGTSWWRL